MTYTTLLIKLSLLLCFISPPSVAAADNFYNHPHTANDTKQFQQQCKAKQSTACAHLALYLDACSG